MNGAAHTVHIHNELSAGHIHLDLMSADLALKRQGGSYAAGPGTAGVGKVLHTALKGALENLVLTGQLAEVDIGPFGKILAVADGAA